MTGENSISGIVVEDGTVEDEAELCETSDTRIVVEAVTDEAVSAGGTSDSLVLEAAVSGVTVSCCDCEQAPAATATSTKAIVHR